MQQENGSLKEHCERLETEVRALRQDMAALQRHVHMPITFCTLDGHDDVMPNHKMKVLDNLDSTHFCQPHCCIACTSLRS